VTPEFAIVSGKEQQVVTCPDRSTHLLVKGAPYINKEAMFGVKESLVQDFQRNLDGKGYLEITNLSLAKRS